MNYTYGKIRILNESLISNRLEASIIEEIMKGGENIKQTDKNEIKALWLLNAMITIDKKLDKETAKKVRQDCACCLGGKRNEICKNINKKYQTVKERIEAANEAKLVFGNSVVEIGKGEYEVAFFPEESEVKTCPCVRGLSQSMPITYCYCCGGHVKHHLETVLGKELTVNVVETILSSLGKKGCRFNLKEM